MLILLIEVTSYLFYYFLICVARTEKGADHNCSCDCMNVCSCSCTTTAVRGDVEYVLTASSTVSAENFYFELMGDGVVKMGNCLQVNFLVSICLLIGNM